MDEWGVRFVDELDYRREAANATQFGEAMRARGLTSLCPAEVVEGLTAQRVLTTEWVDGTRLDESDQGDEARLCGIALNGYLTMLLDTGVLHADPHPGNLLRCALPSSPHAGRSLSLALPPLLKLSANGERQHYGWAALRNTQLGRRCPVPLFS